MKVRLSILTLPNVVNVQNFIVDRMRVLNTKIIRLNG